MGGFLDSLFEDYRLHLERHRNRAFLKGAMAACALAASADGDIRFSERIRVDQILDTLEQLKVFDPHEGVALFNEYAASILRSPREGRVQAQNDVQAACANNDTATRIVRICLAVAEAGGEPGLEAHIETIMLCSLLGVSPERVGVSLIDANQADADPDDEHRPG